MKSRIITVFASLCISVLPMTAQKLSLSTDLLGYACLGTLNAEVTCFLSQKWSVNAGFRYNPFTFNKGQADRQFQNRQRSFHAGARIWPWHTGSGWWFGGKFRWQEYNWGGVFSRETEEGSRLGAGICLGYTHMLSRHLNMEFGAGLWGGYASAKRYSCPVCGAAVKSHTGAFVAPDDLTLSLVYVF